MTVLVVGATGMTGRALVEQLLSKEESQHVEWCSVRPDSLVDAEISSYDIEASLTTGIFTGRPTARADRPPIVTGPQ